MGLAAMMWDTKLPDIVGDLNTFGGSGISVATAKSSKIIAAVNEYDISLARYHDLENHRAAPRTLRAAKTQVELAFRAMNEQFSRASLNYLNNSEYKMRAAKTVTGKDVWESIPVRDNADVIKLEKLAKFGRIAGPGAITFDGYLRANKARHMRLAQDPEWKREAFVQAGAFVGGIVAGAAISAALVPAGASLVVVLVAAGTAAILADRTMQFELGKIFDWVTER